MENMKIETIADKIQHINPHRRLNSILLILKKLSSITALILLSLHINSFNLTLAAAPKIQKQTIKALYIPLADHYAALVAFERYRDQMRYADFQIQQMKNWDLLRAYFQSGEVDMAYVMSPLAMDMYRVKPEFKWIGLMHRDGNALAVNDVIRERVNLAELRIDRKPDGQVAEALRQLRIEKGKPTVIGMPHILSTHTVVLYRYLSEHGIEMSLKTGSPTSEVLAITVPPPKSPAFLRGATNRSNPAAFEQSLPWADIVETGNFGHVVWYSKDVMPWSNGHVECIALATDAAIANKTKALKEVMYYIHLAGADIERARLKGGEDIENIVNIVRKHIPAHTHDAIIASLDPTLNVINYKHLNIDKPGLKQIMDYAVEGGIISIPIDIDDFADNQFAIDLKTIMAADEL